MAIGAVIVTAMLAGAAATGMHFAVKALESKIGQALGADSEVGGIAVGWSSVEIRRLRVKGPKSWPATDALRAERIVVVPDLRSLLSDTVHIRSIHVEGAYLSVLRSRDKRLRLLPGMLEARKGKRGATQEGPPVKIDSITLENSALEFFDATIRQPAHKTRIEQLRIALDHLEAPSLAGRTQVRLDGTIRGMQRNGKIAVNGWLDIAQRNSELAAKLKGVDLVALQPYLVKASETGVRRGSLDLDIKSSVRRNRLHAPGMVTLTGLELLPAGGAFGTFMGVPRQAVVAALKNRDDQITVRFTLQGNLDDPDFSLNEDIVKRLGTSIAESLGISIEGMVRKLFGQ